MKNIFVKNLNGQTLTFQVDLSKQKVKNLLQKYSQKTRIQTSQIAFVYVGKNLSGKQQNLLSDFNIQQNSTIFVVGRLLGGKLVKIVISTVQSKQYELYIDDDKTGYQLKQKVYQFCKSLGLPEMSLQYAGVQIQNDKKISYYKLVQQKGVRKIFQQKGSISNIAGIILAYQTDPYGIDEQTVRMPCGHVIGRDGMTQFVRSLILSHQYQIRCPASKPNGQDCRFQWNFSLCRKIGVFTAQQVKQFQEGLSLNWFEKNSSECPSCKFRVIKGDLKSNRVICPSCKYGDYCYNCSHKWRSNGFQTCGNPHCSYVNTLLMQSQWIRPFQLKQNGKKKIYMLPQLRACVNPNCHEVFGIGTGCKHVQCQKCKQRFCWVCLSSSVDGYTWKCGGYNDYCGKIAQTQII